eukprot:733345_1
MSCINSHCKCVAIQHSLSIDRKHISHAVIDSWIFGYMHLYHFRKSGLDSLINEMFVAKNALIWCTQFNGCHVMGIVMNVVYMYGNFTHMHESKEAIFEQQERWLCIVYVILLCESVFSNRSLHSSTCFMLHMHSQIVRIH